MPNLGLTPPALPGVRAGLGLRRVRLRRRRRARRLLCGARARAGRVPGASKARVGHCDWLCRRSALYFGCGQERKLAQLSRATGRQTARRPRCIGATVRGSGSSTASPPTPPHLQVRLRQHRLTPHRMPHALRLKPLAFNLKLEALSPMPSTLSLQFSLKHFARALPSAFSVLGTGNAEVRPAAKSPVALQCSSNVRRAVLFQAPRSRSRPLPRVCADRPVAMSLPPPASGVGPGTRASARISKHERQAVGGGPSGRAWPGASRGAQARHRHAKHPRQPS